MSSAWIYGWWIGMSGPGWSHSLNSVNSLRAWDPTDELMYVQIVRDSELSCIAQVRHMRYHPMGGGIVPASASSDPCSDLHIIHSINIETISVNIVIRHSRNLKWSHKTSSICSKTNNHWKIIFCINLSLRTPKFQIHNFAAYQAQHSLFRS